MYKNKKIVKWHKFASDGRISQRLHGQTDNVQSLHTLLRKLIPRLF